MSDENLLKTRNILLVSAIIETYSLFLLITIYIMISGVGAC